MNERYQRIQALLEAALERSPQERGAFLASACQGDEDLQKAVESLLDSYEKAGSFLGNPAVERAAPLIAANLITLAPNQLLGCYKVLSPLGSGGMGEVYLAEDTRLKRKVALKLLRPTLTADAERLRRFQQEASAVSALNHPNILTIHELVDTGAEQFIVTEFIDGETLRKMTTRGSLSLEEIIAIGIQIASALEAAHSQGVVHRDIKPENIMVRPDGIVKVLDFGIAKLTEDHLLEQNTDLNAATRVKTSPGLLLGTVSYMSPEQSRGAEVDSRSDIWSMGVVLYEMLTGRMPFEGASISHVVVSIQDDEPAAMGLEASGPSAELGRVIFKALAKDRDERYQSAKELLTDLRSLQEELQFRKLLEKSRRTAFGPDQPPEPLTSEVHLHPNNLPVQLTKLLGRQPELAAIKKLLGREDIRLVTLTGPGGTGKTRLCLQTARESISDFCDGVFFIPLDTISDPDLVAPTIAQTLGIKEAGGVSVIDKLKDHLCGRRVLLAIDNLEQLLNAAPLFAELLNSTTQVKILATSRAALHINGEHEYAVPPLAVPPTGRNVTIDELEQYSSIALFTDRATAVKPDFKLTADNALAVREICSRLDGLPLAIELAAARVKIMSPRALLPRLENRLQLLTGGPRDLPERQQTMRAAISWSHDLLDEDEQRLFRRLSVFVGGFSFEAAEDVCTHDSESAIDFLDGLTSLVDKSLVKQVPSVDDEHRFALLETIREFALEQLSASEELPAVQAKHSAIFLDLVEQSEIELPGANQEFWLERLESELANIRAALRWAEENSKAEMGLRFSGALWRFWERRGYLTEGREWILHFLSLDEGKRVGKARLKALYAAGILADAQCDYVAAQTFFEEKLALHRKLGDKWGVANSLNNLGIEALRKKDFLTAHALYEESLLLWRELGNKSAVALSLTNLGNVADRQGEYAKAETFYNESLEAFRDLQDRRGVALSLRQLGSVARHKGEWKTATALYQQSFAIMSELNDRHGVASLLSEMGDMAWERGDYAASRPLHEEAMVICSELGDVRGIALLFEGYARMAGALGQSERALRLAAAARSLRDEFGAPLSPEDDARLADTLKHVRNKLGEIESAAAWNEGRLMSTERAIQYALMSDTG